MRTSQARANFTFTEAPFSTLLLGILSTALSGTVFGQQASSAVDDDPKRGLLLNGR